MSNLLFCFLFLLEFYFKNTFNILILFFNIFELKKHIFFLHRVRKPFCQKALKANFKAGIKF